jgi:hypothetical protein
MIDEHAAVADAGQRVMGRQIAGFLGGAFGLGNIGPDTAIAGESTIGRLDRASGQRNSRPALTAMTIS